MNSIINQDLSFLQDHLPSSSDKEISEFQYQAAQQLRFNAFQKESQDITVYTEEGDKVTISALEQFQAEYLAFDYSARVKDQAFSYQAKELSASAKNAFQLVVEGDLNEEEQEDIKQVLGELDKVMEDLVSGDLDAVMKRAAGIIDEADTISGLEAVLQFEQRVVMERRAVRQITAEGIGNGMPLPPHPPMMGPKGNESVSFSKLAAKITDQIKEIIEESSVKQEDMKKPVDRYFSDLLGRMSGEVPENDLKTQLVEQIQANVQELI